MGVVAKDVRSGGAEGPPASDVKPQDPPRAIAVLARCESPSVGDRDGRPSPDVMTVEELAQRLRVRPKTVYAAIRHRQIPGIVRVGRLIRISRPTVLAWLAGQDREVRSRRLP